MANATSLTDDDRCVELSSISAIYPELIINPSNPFSASIDVPVEPLKPLAIKFCTAGGPAATELATQPDINLLSYLPALSVEIILPDGYPTQVPPIFRIRTSPSWIPESRIQQLEDAGLTLWKEMGQDQVVFTYLDYLREEAERGFDLVAEDAEFLTLSPDLKLSMLEAASKITQAKFEQTTYDCETCMVPKKGIDCHRLPCGHVSCVNCLQDYFNSCITEGNVSSVKCMECDEDTAQAIDPSELLRIPISQEQVERYVTLQRKKKYELDPATVYCPRKWCEGVARTNIAEEHHQRMREGTFHIPREQRLAICESCDFAFCIHCSASWHGTLVWCTQDGRELSAEEKASEAYMQAHSTRCPSCHSATQKTRGCNHMICGTCKQNFCYICSAKLETRDPYIHYNSDASKSSCRGRLWEKEGGDGE